MDSTFLFIFWFNENVENRLQWKWTKQKSISESFLHVIAIECSLSLRNLFSLSLFLHMIFFSSHVYIVQSDPIICLTLLFIKCRVCTVKWNVNTNPGENFGLSGWIWNSVSAGWICFQKLIEDLLFLVLMALPLKKLNQKLIFHLWHLFFVYIILICTDDMIGLSCFFFATKKTTL